MTFKKWTQLHHLILASSVMWSVCLWSFAQEIDYTPEQYEAYNTCAGMAEAEAKQGCLIEFIEANPKTSLVQYAIAEYGRALQEQIQKGEHEKVVQAGEVLLKYRPDEIKLITQLCYSSYNAGLYEKATKYCDSAYQKNPVPGLIPILVDSFEKTGNSEKYHEWVERAIEQLEPAQSFRYVEEIRAKAARNENWAQAARYSRMTLDMLSKMERTAGTSKEEWDRWMRGQRAFCHFLLGRNAYESGDWSAAVNNYQKVIQYSPDHNLRGESYYYIGMSNWKENRLQPAMEAFARGYAQDGSPHSSPCNEYLIKLYKSTHNGSTAGLDEFIDRTNGKGQ